MAASLTPAKVNALFDFVDEKSFKGDKRREVMVEMKALSDQWETVSDLSRLYYSLHGGGPKPKPKPKPKPTKTINRYAVASSDVDCP
jgi:hypothetical protein